MCVARREVGREGERERRESREREMSGSPQTIRRLSQPLIKSTNLTLRVGDRVVVNEGDRKGDVGT